MIARITDIQASEILDSRGHPTISVNLAVEGGGHATASVPSGASTGTHEAVELRDGDSKRYNGRGVLHAVANVNDIIAPALRGMDAGRQADIDKTLIELDGTPNKSRLGANAILGVSMACARAGARGTDQQLYSYLGGTDATLLPMPMFNVINGGEHADNQLDIQEFMIVPRGAKTFAEALRYAAETFQALRGILKSRGYRVSVGDEGGFAPMLGSNEEAFELIVEAIVAAGFRPGDDIALAIDAAANSFFHDGKYRLARDSKRDMTSAELTALYQQWINKYPIISLEDGLAEGDWDGFREHTAMLGSQVQIVGDDILVTNTKFIARAIAEKTCNAALIKLNQIGTVTETIAAVEMCRRAGWGFVISHRSGETDDTFMADFAVAMGGGQMKSGSVCRGERIAKYNRLLQIERELGQRARFEK